MSFKLVIAFKFFFLLFMDNQALGKQLYQYYSSTCHSAPSLTLFVPNTLHAYRHFLFSAGCAFDVCDRPLLSSPWLDFCSDYSPTAPATPSSRALAPSGSLMRCEPVQVYHRHLISEDCALNASSFVSDVVDSSTMSSHSLSVA
jgi:hypothetical protein